MVLFANENWAIEFICQNTTYELKNNCKDCTKVSFMHKMDKLELEIIF